VTQQRTRKGLDRLRGSATAQAFGDGHEAGSARVPPQEGNHAEAEIGTNSHHLRAFRDMDLASSTNVVKIKLGEILG
jgi:hypothetical protein